MTTASPRLESRPAAKRRRPISRAVVLLLGVLVIPVALTAVFNSYGPLTEAGALRMAAATVAGQTIAILSAVTAVVLTVKRRYALPAILAFVVIAAAVTAGAIMNVTAAGELLLQRLDLIAEIAQLNR